MGFTFLSLPKLYVQSGQLFQILYGKEIFHFPLTNGQILATIPFVVASVAHLVERHLAKVEVASSSLVTRST